MNIRKKPPTRETVKSIITIFDDIYHKPPIEYINRSTLEFTNKTMFKIKVKNMISCYEQILLLVDPKYIPFSFGRTPKQSEPKSSDKKKNNRETEEIKELVNIVQTGIENLSKTEENSVKNLDNIYQVIGHLNSKIDMIARKKSSSDHINEEITGGYLKQIEDVFNDKFGKFITVIKEDFMDLLESRKNLTNEVYGLKEILGNLFQEQKKTTEEILGRIEKDTLILEEMMGYVKGKEEIKDPNFSIEACLEQIQDTNMEIKELLVNLDPTSMMKLRSLENSEFIKHPQVVQGRYMNDSIRSSSIVSTRSKISNKNEIMAKSKTPRIKGEGYIDRSSLQDKISKYITPKNITGSKKNKRTGSFSPANLSSKNKVLNPALIYSKTDQFVELKKKETVNPNKPTLSPEGPEYVDQDRESSKKKNKNYRGLSLSGKNLSKAQSLLSKSIIKKRSGIGNIALNTRSNRKTKNQPPSNVVALVSPRISPALSSENSSFLAFCDIETYIAVQRYTGTTTFVKGKTTHFSTIKSN